MLEEIGKCNIILMHNFFQICRTDSALKFGWFFMFYLVCSIEPGNVSVDFFTYFAAY